MNPRPQVKKADMVGVVVTPAQHKDLSLCPRTHIRKGKHDSVCHPNSGEMQTEPFPGVHWTSSSGPVSDPALKKKMDIAIK